MPSKCVPVTIWMSRYASRLWSAALSSRLGAGLLLIAAFLGMAWYFNRHRYQSITVYSDFYAEAINEGLMRAHHLICF